MVVLQIYNQLYCIPRTLWFKNINTYYIMTDIKYQCWGILLCRAKKFTCDL